MAQLVRDPPHEPVDDMPDAEGPCVKESSGTVALELEQQSSGLKVSPSMEDVAAEAEREEARHSTWRTCVAHIITAVIGAGVLSLPYSFAALGWVAAIAITFVFAAITWFTSQLLADCHVLEGRRMASYMDAVQTSMGPRHGVIIALVQYSNLWLTGIAYNITGATSMQAVACPSASTTCSVDYWVFAVAFGGIQLFISQLPNLDSLWFVSLLGTVMSFGYSIAALILSSYYMAHYGADGSSVGGIPMSSSDKTFAVLNACGDILFAYAFSMILVEISETIKTDARGPVWHMRRAVDWALGITTFFYFAVAATGYAAFGNRTCESILTCYSLAPDGSPSNIPSGIIQAVNIMVCAHVVPAYAIYTQPVFYFVEGSVAHSRRLRAWLPQRLDPARRSARWAFRLVFRSLYVVLVAALAVALPFFSAIVGLVGALGFWPASVAYPVAMYIRKHRPQGRQLLLLRAVDLFSLLVSIAAVIGSVRSLFGGAAAPAPDYQALDAVVTPAQVYPDTMI